MNNFIKNAASGISKPNKKIDKHIDNIALKECIISFNFENFYYSNEKIFKKDNNSLDDVSKSLSIINSFKYEKYVISGLVKILKNLSFISDIFFLPVGWLTGVGENNVDKHFVVKILFTSSLTNIRTKVKDYLSYHQVCDITFVNDKEFVINTFSMPDTLPSTLISFFPFDVNYIIIVLFFGIYNDTYCGLSYISKKDNLNYMIDVLKPMVKEITILSDEITRFVSVKFFDLKPSVKFPEKKIYTISEIIYPFDKSKFKDINVTSNMLISPFINKYIVSIIDLPSNVEIKCKSKNFVDYITHIDNKKLQNILIIAKDNFMQNVIFSGTFKKENIIWKGNYTYRITESTFTVPKLNVSEKGNRKCKKNIFNNSIFTTRIGSYII
ncbi:telomere binding protein [Brazilian porcupinepox virus 1]|nr:telomere binding protein [Brazilian porcupinepox virus 1]